MNRVSAFVKNAWDRAINLISNLRIRSKIFIFLALSVVFYLSLMGGFVFSKMQNVIHDESGDSMLQILKQINNNIDHNLQKYEISLKSFYAGDRFDALIPTVINDYKDMLVYFGSVKNQINMFKSINEGIVELRVFSFNEKIPWDNISTYSAGEIDNEPWAQLLLQKHDNYFYWTQAPDSTVEQLGKSQLLYCYTTVFHEQTHKPLAILCIDVGVDNILGSVGDVDFGKSGVVFAISDSGDFLYYNPNKREYVGDYMQKLTEAIQSGKDEGTLTATIGGQEQFLVFSNKNKLGWYVIGSVSSGEFAEKTYDVRQYLLIMTTTLIAIAFISAFSFSRLVARRMTQLSNVMDAYSLGNAVPGAEIVGNDEVGQMYQHFAEMTLRIGELMNEVEERSQQERVLLAEKYNLEILKKEAELCALQNQINPHFLYNTLEMIKGLLFSENPKDNIIKALHALSSLYKYNLNNAYIVTMQDEIRHIQNYLTIHNLRFDAAVELEIEIDKQTMDTNVVRFTMEPIIENAIKHGFRGIDCGNKIRLTCIHGSGMLTVLIHNNGAGIPAEKLGELNTLLQSGEYIFLSGKEGGGIGIYNVNSRIKKTFGDTFGLLLKCDQTGTTVLLRLPEETVAPQEGGHDV